ncbi:MAG: type II secretion system protein GspM [Pseudomonadota bacterium]
MVQRWKKFAARIDALSLRERALIFGAIVCVLVALIKVVFLDPLLEKQKKMSVQVVQQQEKMKGIVAQIQALLQARKDDANSPSRQRLVQIRQQISEGDAYLKSSSDRLVAPDKIVELLKRVLAKNGQLQLISLQTLPVALLLEKSPKRVADAVAAPMPMLEKQLFKHGVQITIRGNYHDLLQYLAALEQLPAQMFWGAAKLSVVQHPTAELTLTVYTLSLEKVWLKI